MKIINIFEIINESLYSVHYNNCDENEFRIIFDKLTDAEYLESFFETHKADLENGFWGEISLEEAILITRREALRLESEMIEIAEKGKGNSTDNLSNLFKPLHDSTTTIEEFEKNKLTGDNRPSWIRIYAIRVEANLFVITGGAIKLTRTMNEREHLLEELKKLDFAKDFLQDEDNYDLPFFELIL